MLLYATAKEDWTNVLEWPIGNTLACLTAALVEQVAVASKPNFRVPDGRIGNACGIECPVPIAANLSSGNYHYLLGENKLARLTGRVQYSHKDGPAVHTDGRTIGAKGEMRQQSELAEMSQS